MRPLVRSGRTDYLSNVGGGSQSRQRARRITVAFVILPVAYGMLILGHLSWTYLRYKPGWAREQPAVRRVVALGGRTVGRYGGGLSLWDYVRCRHLDYLGDRVTGVILSNTQVTDGDLALLSVLPGLHYLDLPGTRITDVGLRNLQNNRGLWELNLASTAITDDGLRFLANLPLVHLDLSDTSITDQGLEHLRGLVQLKYLSLKGSMVSRTQAEALKLALPKLTKVEL